MPGHRREGHTIAEDEAYQRAKKRVKDIKGFYSHLFTYILVNALLFAINMITSPDSLWFYWPLLGWGVAVVAHGFSVFAAESLLGREWEERKTRDIMERERAARHGEETEE